jgi:ribonuclease HI
VFLISPQGEQLNYTLQIHYNASNNGAEYEALIHRLCIAVSLGIKRLLAFGDSKVAVSLGIKRLLAFGDSKVVIEQVNKEWDCV